MYYYFQRAKALERDLYAIQRGELDPSEAGRSFLGQLRNYNNNIQRPSSSTLLTDPDIEASSTPSAPEAITNISPTIEPDLPPASIAVEEDNGLRLDPLEDTPAGEEDYVDSDISDEPDTLPPGAEESPINNDGLQPETGQNTDEAQPSGESLYDMEAPTVRVRAPRRN